MSQRLPGEWMMRLAIANDSRRYSLAPWETLGMARKPILFNWRPNPPKRSS